MYYKKTVIFSLEKTWHWNTLIHVSLYLYKNLYILAYLAYIQIKITFYRSRSLFCQFWDHNIILKIASAALVLNFLQPDGWGCGIIRAPPNRHKKYRVFYGKSVSRLHDNAMPLSSWQALIIFLFLFVGSSHTQGDFVFMKYDIKWAFLHIF